jgi:hypothetical protein
LQNYYANGVVTFYNSGTIANAQLSTWQSNTFTMSSSATTGGVFTITATNNSPYSATNCVFRLIKVNFTGAD